jgi:hypothetical protein
VSGEGSEEAEAQWLRACLLASKALEQGVGVDSRSGRGHLAEQSRALALSGRSGGGSSRRGMLLGRMRGGRSLSGRRRGGRSGPCGRGRGTAGSSSSTLARHCVMGLVVGLEGWVGVCVGVWMADEGRGKTVRMSLWFEVRERSARRTDRGRGAVTWYAGLEGL